MSALRLEGVGVHQIVGPVDLTVHAGECVCVSGPSGAGKSLLLRAVADLDPHEGRVFLDGVACMDLPAPQWRRRVGLLPAESAWWAERVGDHFADGMDSEPLQRLGFDQKVMNWSVARASTGERQRLALLRLLANQPRALLLDEPTAALDPKNVKAVEALVAEYRARHDAPVIWVSHDPEQIARVAQRHFRIVAGRLEQAVHT